MKVLVVGGGIVGAAVAWRLAQEGASVEVFEGERPEAATAASGGMLGFRSELLAAGPVLSLGQASAELWGRWCEALGGHALLGWVPGGTAWLVQKGEVETFLAERAFQVKAGLPAPVLLEDPRTHGLPDLHPDLRAISYPDECALHPPSTLRALRAAAVRAGAVFHAELATGLSERGGRCQGVQARDRTLEADAVVLAAGSWSSSLIGEHFPLPITAVRGQVALFDFECPVVLRSEAFYLVPRPGKKVLVGATEEPVTLSQAGEFSVSPSSDKLQLVREAAARLLPALKGLEPRALLSGLRPWSADRQPLVGAAPESLGLEGLFLAAGHTRNGILLAPLTAEAICQAVLGQSALGQASALPPALDFTLWDPARFQVR